MKEMQPLTMSKSQYMYMHKLGMWH